MPDGQVERDRRGRVPLVLASGSPQRRAILERLGVTFSVRPSGASELEHGDPDALAHQNALRKVRAARAPGAEEAVLGCDTIVALDGVIYGKPADQSAAGATLRALSGRTHEVISGLALLIADGGPQPAQRSAVVRTAVTFRALSAELVDWYVATGEWQGRSGAYAIQGAGAALVRSVHGDYQNVVGLPLATLLDLYPKLLPG